MRLPIEWGTLLDPTIVKGWRGGVLISPITDNYPLTVDHPSLLFLDPNGGAKDLLFPNVNVSLGLIFIVVNTADAAEAIVPKKHDDSAFAPAASIEQSEMGLFVCDGVQWRGMTGAATMTSP